jgi:hypothetical protein
MKIVSFLFHMLLGSFCLLGFSFIVLAIIGLIKYIW